MRNEPFHHRTWAELLFFFGASALIGVLNGVGYLEDGGIRDFISAAAGTAVALVLAFQIWRKIKDRGFQPAGNKDRIAS